VGLFLCAAAGVILGRHASVPGAAFAAAGAVALLAALALGPGARIALPVGVALVFAAAQAWTFRESRATRLAAELTVAEQTCSAVITVREAPREGAAATGLRSRFAARLEELTLDDAELRPGCLVMVTWDGPPPLYGGRYRVRAAIGNCPPVRNPGAFDYTGWLANAGIRSQLAVLRGRDAELLAVGGNPLVRFADAARGWIEETITRGIAGTAEAMLIRAMVIGDTADAPDSIKDAFRETGTFHLFSVSGLHVGIVAVILWTALGLFGVSQRHSVLIIIPALFFYALVTGLSPASLRAAIMLSIIAAGLLLDRPPTPLNSIGAAGLVILLGDSSQLFNSGFQLSFGAVTAIILLAHPLRSRITARFEPDPFLPTRLIGPLHHLALKLAGGAATLVAVSFAAWLVSLPLTIWYFHLVSLSSIPANLFAVPLSSAVLGLAAISIVSGIVSPWLATVFNHANFLLAKLLLVIVQAFAAIPGSSFYVGPAAPAGTFATLTVLDAGAGGSAVLLADGLSWVIDPGGEFFADTVTIPFLRMHGVNALDGLALTHGDAKHIGGTERLLDTIPPREVLDSGLPDRSPNRKRVLAMLAARGIPLVRAQAGLTLPLAPIPPPARLTVLYPPANARGISADDKALVLRIEAGGFTALLISDAGVATEQWLLAHAPKELACDLLVMGRHISGLSGDPDFLRAAKPQALIASVADFPPTERLRPGWPEAVHALGIALYRQDETGAVTVTVQRGQFTATPFLATGGASRMFPLSHAPDPLR
jgi:ComEC/Rec2-related protein